MGAPIIINDTLKLKRGETFPQNIAVGQTYDFTIKGRRIYNMNPSRVFLVEEVDGGLWNYIGHAMILSMTIDPVNETTSGRYQITQIYPRDYARQMNQLEPPEGRRGYTGD